MRKQQSNVISKITGKTLLNKFLELQAYKINVIIILSVEKIFIIRPINPSKYSNIM